jgi:selenocysteine-specific elongation factor
VEEAVPGWRTAVNLAGVAVEELSRGVVVTAPGWLRPTTVIDVWLRTVRGGARPVRHDLEVTFHTGSSETEGRLILLDAEELKRGESGWAQLRLSAPVAVINGDHFVIRDPNDTLGGGKVVDAHARRHRRFHSPTIAALELLREGTPEEALLAAVAAEGPVTTGKAAARAGLDANRAVAAADRLLADGRLVCLDSEVAGTESLLCTSTGFSSLTERARDALSAFHRQAPLRPGMPREELRSRLRLAARAFDALVTTWDNRGDLKQGKGTIGLAGHEPEPTAADNRRMSSLLEELRSNPFAPAPSTKVDEGLLAYMEGRGEIVRAGDGVVFATSAYEEMVGRIEAYLKKSGSITLGEVRDMFGTSRKYAQALLEHMDGEHLTRRVGDARVLGNQRTAAE